MNSIKISSTVWFRKKSTALNIKEKSEKRKQDKLKKKKKKNVTGRYLKTM